MKILFSYNENRQGEFFYFLATWFVLVASFILKPQGYKDLALPWGQTLPSFSIIHYFTKFPGPTCGLTRSFVNMAHFRIGDAFRAHFLGPFLFFGLAFALGYFSYRTLGGQRKLLIKWSKTGLRIALALGLLIFLGAWLAKIALGFY